MDWQLSGAFRPLSQWCQRRFSHWKREQIDVIATLEAKGASFYSSLQALRSKAPRHSPVKPLTYKRLHWAGRFPSKLVLREWTIKIVVCIPNLPSFVSTNTVHGMGWACCSSADFSWLLCSVSNLPGLQRTVLILILKSLFPPKQFHPVQTKKVAQKKVCYNFFFCNFGLTSKETRELCYWTQHTLLLLISSFLYHSGSPKAMNTGLWAGRRKTRI